MSLWITVIFAGASLITQLYAYVQRLRERCDTPDRRAGRVKVTAYADGLYEGSAVIAVNSPE